MRIAFFTTRISLSSGGIQNTSYHFANEFNKHCDFNSFCTGGTEDAQHLKNIHESTKKVSLLQHFELLRLLFKAHKSKPFDFCMSVIYPYALAPYFLKLFNKIPYGIMVHGNELMDFVGKNGKKPKEILKRLFRRQLIKNAAIIFANSEYTKELCKNIEPRANVAVIHPPIQYTEKDISFDAKTYILFSVGRLVERKGFQYVIQAMPQILKEFPQMKYYVAGKGEYGRRLNDLIKENGLEKSVFLLGSVDEAEKDRLFSNCDYFIMPSYIVEKDSSVEGFGIVYLEANMYGKFVIGTREGGAPEAIIDGKTGIFVDPCNPDDIAEKIIGLYQGKYEYRAEDCVRWAKEGGVENIVEQYIAGIKNICMH